MSKNRQRLDRFQARCKWEMSDQGASEMTCNPNVDRRHVLCAAAVLLAFSLAGFLTAVAFAKTPLELVRQQPKPKFRSGHTLPPLTPGATRCRMS